MYSKSCSWFLAFLNLITNHSEQLWIPPFHGEISIENYLLKYYNSNSEINYNNKDKIQFFLINNLIFKNFSSQILADINISNFHRHLQSAKIDHIYLNSITDSRLIEIIPKPVYYQSQNVLIIFDLNNMINLNENDFFQQIKTLNKIFVHCVACKPFLILLNMTFNKLIKLIEKYYNMLTKQFQATFISSHYKYPIHINPIINGCLFYRGIYVPNSTQKMKKLLVQTKDCNLTNQTLKVSISHWKPFCDIERRTEPNQMISLKRSMEGELLNVLKTKYRFKISLVDGNDVWGKMFPNGTWNGMISDVINEVS